MNSNKLQHMQAICRDTSYYPLISYEYVVSSFSKFGDRATAHMKLAKLQPRATEACHFGA
jgi:hypothetical protein